MGAIAHTTRGEYSRAYPYLLGTTVNRYSRETPFVYTFQSGWRERAADTRLPLWQRVAFLAYGSIRANGHATFPKGELARKFDVSSQEISHAIRTAKDRNFLSRESKSECLVVPPHFVTGGLGHGNDPCAVHDGRHIGAKRVQPKRPVHQKPSQRVTVVSSRPAEGIPDSFGEWCAVSGCSLSHLSGETVCAEHLSEYGCEETPLTFVDSVNNAVESI